MKPNTLDPTPTMIELRVDTEAPEISAQVVPARVAIAVRAHDVVSGDRLIYRLVVDGEAREVVPDADGLVDAPELLDTAHAIEVEVIDEIGNVASRVIRTGLDEEIVTPASSDTPKIASCACVGSRSSASPWTVLASISIGLALLLRRRRIL